MLEARQGDGGLHRGASDPSSQRPGSASGLVGRLAGYPPPKLLSTQNLRI